MLLCDDEMSQQQFGERELGMVGLAGGSWLTSLVKSGVGGWAKCALRDDWSCLPGLARLHRCSRQLGVCGLDGEGLSLANVSGSDMTCSVMPGYMGWS